MLTFTVLLVLLERFLLNKWIKFICYYHSFVTISFVIIHGRYIFYKIFPYFCKYETFLAKNINSFYKFLFLFFSISKYLIFYILECACAIEIVKHHIWSVILQTILEFKNMKIAFLVRKERTAVVFVS